MKDKLLHLQTLVTVALCVLFAMCFTSCSNNEEDEPEKPKVEKRMKSVDKTTFVYSGGKITKTLWEGDERYEIVYNESSIKIGSTTYYLTNGLVTRIGEIGGKGDQQEFTYQDGRIKTWKKYSNGVLDEDISFEWKDGVIVRQTDIERTREGNMEVFRDYHYSYTSDPDYGGAVAVFQSDSLFFDNLPEELIIQGYFGKWPKYLVSSAIDATGYFSDSNFTYILDSDGYPLQINGDEKANFTWENIQ